MVRRRGNSDDTPPNPPTLDNLAAVGFPQPSITQAIQKETLGEILQNSNFPTEATLPGNPVHRLMEQILFHGDEEALIQLDRYLMKFDMEDIPMDVIARSLDVSVRTARRLMTEYKDRLRKQMERLEAVHCMADTLTAIKAVRTKFMRKMEHPDSSFTEQCYAADRIMKSETLKYKVLETTGYFARKSYAPPEQDDFAPRQEATYITDMLKNILSGKAIEEDLMYKDSVINVQLE